MSASRTIVVERISYTVFAIRGGKLLKTWARIGPALKPITATTEARLRAKLKRISIDLLNGQTEAAGLEPSDHREFLAARESLARLGRPIRVDSACREYADSAAILGAVPLSEAARFYQTHNSAVVRKTIGEALEAYALRLLRLSAAYREICLYDLERFARVAGSQRFLDEVTTADLEKIVASTGRTLGGKWRPASEHRREQVRTQLVTFFNFARTRLRALPKNLDHAAHALEAEETMSEPREVWDPQHLRRALESVWAHERAWLPWLAISALGNVRSQGARRLDWTDVHWLDDLLELTARKSKVKKRVTVPISTALASWLDPYRGQRGSICPEKGFGAFTARLRNKYVLPYYKNVIRRSYITYLLAETDDEEYVALVSNTSVAKVRDTYRQIRTFSGRLVTKDLASGWFATARVAALNVVQLELPA